MSAEGIGITIGFVSLFLTIIGLGIGAGVAYGTLKTMVINAIEKLTKMDDENRLGHKEIYDAQNHTDVAVGRIEEHLSAINGTVKTNSGRITELERSANND